MEWEIGTLGRGKYRLSLVRIAEGETLCEVLEDGAAQACLILSGDLDVARPGGRTQIAGAGKLAVMSGSGTYCLHANQDTLALRGSLHSETICNPGPPRTPTPRRPGWGDVAAGIAVGGAMFGSMLGLWATLRGAVGRPGTTPSGPDVKNATSQATPLWASR